MQEVFEKIIIKINKKIEHYDSRHKILTDSGMFGEADRIAERMVELDFVREIVKHAAADYNNGWIPVEEELPKDGDNRYYMCIVENHEEDPPMFCQYDEECGFGFYKDIYDEHTLGFVDCEFNTNEELGYEKVIAWQQLLPYQPKGE